MIPEEIWQEVLKGIASGLTNRDACARVGVKENSFYFKRKSDPEFDSEVKRALIAFKLKHINVVARDPSWQSSAWLLERKFREEFGRNFTLPNEPPEPIEAPNYEGLTAEELALYLELERKVAQKNKATDDIEDAEIVEESSRNLDSPKGKNKQKD